MNSGTCHVTGSCIFSQDMVHIADTKIERGYADYFIKQIHKFEEVSLQHSVVVGIAVQRLEHINQARMEKR